MRFAALPALVLGLSLPAAAQSADVAARRSRAALDSIAHVVMKGGRTAGFVADSASDILVRAGQAPIARDIGSRDAQTYALTLGRDQMIWAVADQQSVDVVVRVMDPAGVVLATFDGPARGPEAFRFVSRRPGRHRIEIRSFAGTSGRYTFRVERVEPVARTAAGKVDQLMRVHDRRDAPGAVIAVVRAGRIVFTKAYGMANLEHGIPNTAGSVFHVASVSKQLTAFAIARLAEEGRLSLDDDVRKFVPDVPDFGVTITLRNLLHHTSGLRDQWVLWEMSGGRLDDVITQENLLDLVRRQRTLDFRPGTEHQYSNTNYMLLAQVVERVTGEPFAAYMQRTVFAPLGMTSTTVYNDHERIQPRRADSYQPGLGGQRRAVLSFANQGATSVHTTAADLARWLANMGTGRVGGLGVIRRMQERGVLASGDTIAYALGLVIDEHRGLRRLQHGGADAGYRAMVAYYPALDAGVAVLGNSAAFDAAGALDEVAASFFGDRMRAPTPAIAPSPGEPDGAVGTSDSPPTSWRPEPAELAQYAGRYHSAELEAEYVIAIEGDGLTARHRRHGRIQLAAQATRDAFRGDRFYFDRLRFVRGTDGRITTLLVSAGLVRDVRFERRD